MKTLLAALLLLVVGGCTMGFDVRFVQTPGVVVERTEMERTTETRTTETTRAATNPPVVLQKVDPCVECDRIMKGMVEK